MRNWFRKKQRQAEPDLVQVELTKIGGPPELDFLFIEVSSIDIQRALDGWRWIGLHGLTAIAVSAFGEIFFRATDGSIHHLDTIEGSLTKVADKLADFAARLQDAQGRDQLLLGAFVNGARGKGLLLAEGECYDFSVAPVLGGEMSSEAMEKLSFVVKLHITGQLHEQVKGLPPGTRINKVTISD